MPDFAITQNDVLPALTGTLTYDDGTPANLAGASVQLVLSNPEASTTYLTAACSVTGPNTVVYNWQTGDTAVPGDYLGQFVVTFATGIIQSFPTDHYFSLTVTPALTGSVKPRPDYYSTSDLISDVRGYLDGRARPSRNRLAGDVDTVTETFSLRNTLGGAVPGAQLSVGLETMYVESSVGQQVTVARGADGTTPSAHKSGDIVLVNPEFTGARIMRAVNDELRALPGDGIYAVKSLDRTLSATAEGYDLAPDVLRVVDVRWQHKWDSTEWTAVDSYEPLFNMPTTVFPSGVGLKIPERPFRSWPNNVFVNDGNLNRALRIRYFAPLGTLTTLFDDVLATTLIPETALDIIAIGAAVRLMSGRPVQRVTSLGQPDSRNAAEVRAADVLNSAAALRQLRADRVTQEAAQLSSDFVWRKPARRLMG